MGSDSLQTAGGCVELGHPVDLSGTGFDDGPLAAAVPAHKVRQPVEQQTVRAARTSRPLYYDMVACLRYNSTSSNRSLRYSAGYNADSLSESCRDSATGLGLCAA
jgi:hypothetical protein